MKKYFDLRIKDAGGGETMTPQKEHFNKCINALHLELPQSVWNDVHFNWMKLREEIGKDKERIAELEKEVDRLRGLVEEAFDYARDNRFSTHPSMMWNQFKAKHNL